MTVTRDTDNPGLPLGHFLTAYRCAGVRLTCLDCQKHEDLPIAPIAERLQARGVGGLDTGVRELGRLVERPCRRCGGRRFVTAPAWR